MSADDTCVTVRCPDCGDTWRFAYYRSALRGSSWEISITNRTAPRRRIYAEGCTAELETFIVWTDFHDSVDALQDGLTVKDAFELIRSDA